jgi:hypothetical protein
METLGLDCSFTNEIVNGIQIKGLLLQGCNFESGRLTDAYQNMSELTALPVCHLGWVSGVERQDLNLPVYHSLNREKLLCKLGLPFSG